jgi:lipopolysaccharide export system permease protein
LKRIDRLILSEMIGPWIFGVAIFTVIIMAGSFLFQLTNYMVNGISPSAIFSLTGLLLPGVMVKTFAMAVLLSALLAFGKLSGDSEIVAMKAAGASVLRIMVPVALFGTVVAVLYFVTDEVVVAPAANKAEALKNDIQKHLSGTTNRIQQSITDENGRIQASMMAQDFDITGRHLADVMIEFYDKSGHPSGFLWAPGMQFTGNSTSILDISASKNWRLDPGSKLFHFHPNTESNLGSVYPDEAGPEPPNPTALLADQLKNLDALNMLDTKAAVDKLQKDPKANPGTIANLWYGYYNKISLPLATIVFALVGAPLGIRSHRTGTATGFALSVVIIFAYMMLSNWMSIYSTGQRIPPYAASFAPIGIGLVCAIVLVYKRNQS